ncbi:DNA repair protein RecN [Alphaproteobacteria bacterium]
MLISLTIQNFIIIDHAYLEFERGLTAISGESGAGKSVILDALLLCCGAIRATKIAKDATKSVVITAEFVLDQNVLHISDTLNTYFQDFIECEKQAIIRRIIAPDGRTRFFINDIIATATQVRELSDCLLEVCTQNLHQGWLSNKNHVNILDEFANITGDVQALSSIFKNWRIAQDELDRLTQILATEQKEREYLKHTIEELGELGLGANEEGKLILERQQLTQIYNAKSVIVQALGTIEGSNNQIYVLQKSFSKFGDLFKDLIPRLENINIEMEDVIAFLHEVNSTIGADENRLAAIENRLSLIRKLTRKYDTTSERLNDILIEAKEKFEMLDQTNEKIQELQETSKAQLTQYIDLAQKLSDIRQISAKSLLDALNRELMYIGMHYVEFKINIVKLEKQFWHSGGTEKINFAMRSNQNSNYEDVEKIASGGELSRIILAFKAILSNIKAKLTIVFDEVDVGIGGAIASHIGHKLSVIAKNRQVVIITHQPQVAAYSDQHFAVKKQVTPDAGQVQVCIDVLNDEGKRMEIARMLSDKEINDESILAANKLIENANSLKKQMLPTSPI